MAHCSAITHFLIGDFLRASKNTGAAMTMINMVIIALPLSKKDALTSHDHDKQGTCNYRIAINQYQ